jgi:hypothetical protein
LGKQTPTLVDGRPDAAPGWWSERTYLVDLAVIFITALAGLVWLVGWLDNPQALTSNGVFKAMTVRDWLNDPVKTPLDPSNFHYYPLMALLCHLLDLMGVQPGDPRRQIALINCLFGAVCLCIVYLLARAVTGRRDVAWAAAAFHLGGAFFLNLSISNEDIIPSYTFLLGAMALAAVWFVNPTPTRIAIVAVVFALSWLFEWRLMFPTLPALLVAVTLAPAPIWKRGVRVVIFLAAMVGTAEIAMQLWGPHNGNVGTVRDLLWTGKAVESGWAGFATRKLVFLWVGITEYLLGGRNLGDLAYLSAIIAEVLVATTLITLIGIGWLMALWRDVRSLDARVLSSVFGLNFLAGEFFNSYSQPQDPQMQINVMIWLTVAWATIIAVANRRYGRAMPPIALALAAILLTYNIHRMAPARGADGQWRDALLNVERHADPARTVFLVHGFEPFVSETFYEWRGDWNYFQKLGPAPFPLPKIKLLAFVNGPIHQPNASGDELAADLSRQIAHAMDLGYQVVADYVWELSEASFTSYMATVADVSKASTIYRTLHARFTGTPLFVDPVAGAFFRLQRAD